MLQRRFLRLTFLVVSLLVASTAMFSCANEDEQKKPQQGEDSIIPQPKFQEQIEQTMRSFSGKDRDAIHLEIDELKKLANRDYVTLVRQLAFHAGTQQDGENVVLLLVLLEKLKLHKETIVTALAPYVGSQNKMLSSFVEDWFDSHHSLGETTKWSALRAVDYTHYKGYIQTQLSKAQPIPEKFVGYIFSVYPGYALRAFVYAYKDAQNNQRAQIVALRLKQINELLWAEHVVSDAIWKKENGFDDAFRKAKSEVVEEMTKLSKHEHWWVRLYVAEIMQQHPELRVADVMQELKQDQHDLVKQAITRKETPRGLEEINNPPNTRPVELPE